MRRFKLFQVVLPAIMLLAGCKSDLTADIALSELSAPASYLEAHLSVEVRSPKPVKSTGSISIL